MKKLLFVFCLFSMIVCSAKAENVSIKDLSFSELSILRDRCQYEMMNSTGWKEVTVPQGIWLVGKDIPAGTWVIKCADIAREKVGMRICNVKWGIGYPDFWGGGFSPENEKGSVKLANPYNDYYEKYEDGSQIECRIQLEDGYYLLIENLYNSVVFMKEFSEPAFSFD